MGGRSFKHTLIYEVDNTFLYVRIMYNRKKKKERY